MSNSRSISVPEKPTLDGIESKWANKWKVDGTFAFDRTKSRDEIYSIDTPPPTVSGSLHIGHCFSYTHTDLIARFQRMRGKEVFYPMGWDDNGLNSERRVQVMRGIRCDPSLPYDANFVPPAQPDEKNLVPVSRQNFVEECKVVTEELEAAYEFLWTTLGLSVDWSMTYATIGDRARRASQRGFLRMFKQGKVFNADAPSLWETQFQTGIAQAELTDKEIPGAYHRIAFHKADGSGDVLVDTTRPELIAADVAILVHPEDERFRDLVGTELISPLFGVRLPVFAHTGADPEKGTGVVMVSTWGDLSDVEWWRELKLPLRSVIQRDGRLRPIKWGEPGWESEDVAKAQKTYDQIAGLNVKKAQAKMVELLRESGELVEEPKEITHAVKFWENGKIPLEIISHPQWFIKILDNKEDFLKRGEQLQWHPDHMKVRFEHWVNGLNQEWNINRQRFFGVPFPVWYKVDADGDIVHEQPILPEEKDLPIDPSSDIPSGYKAEQRNQPNGFVGDPDIMDTWATSSLTPQIASYWEDDEDLYKRLYPMDLRPQAHEIIRTWLFYTIVRSEYEEQKLPWKHAAISGFVVDNDRKKLGKSTGNAKDQPIDLLSQYGSDAVRYWAANAGPGLDAPLDHNQMKIGRKLATKLLNASKFVLAFDVQNATESDITEPLDLAMRKQLAHVATGVTDAFENYDYARALQRVEEFFWYWCDNYIELAKVRAYGNHGDEKARSAKAGLSIGLETLQKLFAPFLAFTSEEVWSWWKDGSVHRQAWPEFVDEQSDSNMWELELVARVLGEARGAKTTAQKSMKTAITELNVVDSAENLELIRKYEDDIRDAGVIEKITYEEGEPSVSATIAE